MIVFRIYSAFAVVLFAVLNLVYEQEAKTAAINALYLPTLVAMGCEIALRMVKKFKIFYLYLLAVLITFLVNDVWLNKPFTESVMWAVTLPFYLVCMWGSSKVCNGLWCKFEACSEATKCSWMASITWLLAFYSLSRSYDYETRCYYATMIIVSTMLHGVVLGALMVAVIVAGIFIFAKLKFYAETAIDHVLHQEYPSVY
jgi:hypothetical protein